jgi:hypothetical protein
MSLGAIAVRRRHGGGGGGLPPVSGALALGMGLAENGWDLNYFVNKWHAGGYETDTGAGVPAANRDANGNPTSIPAGSSAISKAITNPPGATKIIDVYYDGTITLGSLWHYTLNSNVAGHINITADNSAGGGLPPALRYTIPNPADPPRNFRAIIQGDTEADVIDLTIKSRLQAVSDSRGPIRFMDMCGVNRNGGASLGAQPTWWEAPWCGGTQSSPLYKITNTNRTKFASGEWSISAGDTGSPVNSGLPIEAGVQMANLLNRDMWWCANWCEDPAKTQYDLDYVRDNLNPTLKFYLEISNEVWNGGFSQHGQCLHEAGYNDSNNVDASNQATRTSGVALTPVAMGNGACASRYIERVIEASVLARARFALPRTGGGSKPTLQMVAAWQHAGVQSTGINAFLDYTPDGGTHGPLKNNIDVFASAPYADPATVAPWTGNYPAANGYLPLIDALYKDASSNTIRIVSSIRAACDARSLVYAFYEFSPNSYLDSDNTTDAAVATNLHHSAEMGEWMSWYLQRLEAATPGSPACWYAFINSISSRYGTWNLFELPYQDLSSTYKYIAAADYVSGKRKLAALYGQFIAPVGAANGTVVARVKRRLIGSTVSITSAPAGAFSIVDATALDLVIQVADSTKFTSAGTITYDIAETGGSPSTTKHTTGSCPVTAATFWDWGRSATDFDINGSSALSATRLTNNGSDKNLWASAARTSGYFELDIVSQTGNMVIGFASAAFVNNVNPGGAANSVGWYQNGGALGVSGGTGFPAFTSGDQPDVFLSPTKKLYVRKNNGSWIGADGAGSVNPATDTGGLDVSSALTGAGPWYPVVDMVGNGSAVTARFADANFIHSKPAGQHDWTVVPDLTAPVLTSPTGAGSGASGATIGATTDEGNGIMYGVITSSSTQPTKAQIKAGLNAAGAATPNGTLAIGSTGAKTISIFGATVGATYFGHVMQEDDALNQSNVVTSASFVAAAAGPQLNPTNGVNKHAAITLSNANLTAATDNDGRDELVRATRATIQSGAFEYEANIASVGHPIVGIEDGTTDLSAYAVVPGSSNNFGVAFQWFSGAWYILRGGGVSQGPFASATPTVNGKITVRGNKSGGTVGFYRDGVQIGVNETGVSFTNWYAFVGGRDGTNTLTVNFAGPFSFGTDPAY